MKTRQTKKLGEICDFQNGFAFKSSEYVDSGYFVMRIGNVQDGYISLSDPKYIKKCHKPFDRFILSPGDILVSLTGNVGRVGVIDEHHLPAVINQRVARISLKSGVAVAKDYLFYFLKSPYFIDELIKAGHGAAQQNVSTKDIEKLEISLPLISEQKRIAKKLDEVFEKTAEAKENAEKNLKNSKELFESYLQSVFVSPGKDWEDKRFDEIVQSNVIGLVKNSKEQSVRKKYKYVKMNNITRDNRFDFSKYTRVDASQSELEKYGLMAGDFLFNTRNSYELVGKTCIFNDDEEKGILFNNNIMRVRFIKSVNSYFINYAFSSRFIIEKLSHLKNGTTNVSAIYYKDLKNLVLPVPSLSEQKSIVKKLDGLSLETKKLEKIYAQKLTDLEELKKSVLSKAFYGEL